MHEILALSQLVPLLCVKGRSGPSTPCQRYIFVLVPLFPPFRHLLGWEACEMPVLFGTLIYASCFPCSVGIEKKNLVNVFLVCLATMGVAILICVFYSFPWYFCIFVVLSFLVLSF